jgi:prevent-host-death family protein
MQTLSANDAKYGFGRLIDLARAEPVTIEKHGRPVAVVLSVEDYERLQAHAAQIKPMARPRRLCRQRFGPRPSAARRISLKVGSSTCRDG